ncbi:hypothetical protein BGX38DRAFT_1270963 [Terfezia claveryi]|nr:hypothetical protein BGX38DRAFT_1270963 [Terfezia claveryi]
MKMVKANRALGRKYDVDHMQQCTLDLTHQQEHAPVGARSTPPPESQQGKAPPETQSKGKGRLAPPPEIISPSPTLARTMVLHAAPTKFKPGQMRRWIEEDNKLTGVQILGIRWLTQEHRRAGKMASSLVIYMKDRINLDQGLRMGRRFFRTTVYDWNR